MDLKVNEIFGPTVQGEGKSAGRPVAFLRLSMCNLHCIWCDTPHTWNWEGTPFAHPKKFKQKKEVHSMTVEEVLAKVEKTSMISLVVSGGEPFLQQKQLIPLVKSLKEKHWWIEVETNGTVMPNLDFMRLVDQVNCSPKLSNSLDDSRLRIRPKALHALSSFNKVNFKFVISGEQDIEEVLSLVRNYDMREVRLMPECQTKEELLSKSRLVQQLCDEHGFIFCTRLSVLLAGTERGV